MKRSVIIWVLALAGMLVLAVAFVLVAMNLAAQRSVTAAGVEPAQPEEDAVLGEAISAATAPACGEDEASACNGIVAPQGFDAFFDDALHFSLVYPETWAEGQRVFEYSRLFYEKDIKPEGLGPLPLLYVTFIPRDDSLAEGTYGFMSIESIQSFQALAAGESQPLTPDAMPAEAFTYTRLPDRDVAGNPAVVIENEVVWEAPEETTDRRVLVETEAGYYILGTIYETPEQLALFEQVLDSFQVTQ